MPSGPVRQALQRAVPAALVALAAGCYSTTPHRAEIASRALPQECAAAVEEVFARSGFVQLPTPPNLSMFFSPRMSGQYSAFLGTGVGVGVTIDVGSRDACHVTLEALSPDVGCADEHQPLACGGSGGVRATPALGTYPSYSAAGTAPFICPSTPSVACALSYAPGSSNDAAVDELARRLRARLGVAVATR